MNAAKVESELADAGLRLVEFQVDGCVVPVAAAWLATTCSPTDGRVDEQVSLDDPQLVDKANVGWFRLATDYGLFDDSSKFLLSVESEDDNPGAMQHWACVQLADPWDIMGKGAASSLLGLGYGRPEFAMLSLDGQLAMRATTWQSSVSSLVVPKPHLVPALRRYVQGKLDTGAYSERWRTQAAAWLEWND